MNKIKRWVIGKRFLMKNPLKFFCFQVGEKKYLAIHYSNWRGVKVRRKFEVVTEVDDNLEPIGCEEWVDAVRLDLSPDA